MLEYEKYKIFDMIVACDSNWGIGYQNNLLVRLPEDMEFFKEQTKKAGVVIMGSNTQKSLPRGYLIDRKNIVLTTKHKNDEYLIQSTPYKNTEIIYVNSLCQIMSYLKHHTNANTRPMVIGGAQIYHYFIKYDLIGRIFLTKIDYEFENVDTWIDNLHDYGFQYDPQNPLHMETDYTRWTESSKVHNDSNGKAVPYDFYIHTLTKK